jgi:hypothetical protein
MTGFMEVVLRERERVKEGRAKSKIREKKLSGSRT